MDRAALDARLRAKALACVAQREHSRVELRRKLFAYLDRLGRAAIHDAGVARPSEDEADVTPGDNASSNASRVDALLDWLAERDLLSVERFVETRVQARLARFGQLRIRQELARHGAELDAPTAQRLRDTEFERARALWARRFDVPADARERSRQLRFLLARGFSADVIHQVLRGAGALPSTEDD